MNSSSIQVSAREGLELSRQTSLRYDAADLETMEICFREPRPPTSGKELAGTLRRWADVVEEEHDAAPTALATSRWMTMMMDEPPQRERNWTDLAALAFWTVRNAAWSWETKFDGTALRELPVRWFQRSNEKRDVPGSSLRLKIHPLVNIHHGGKVIVAPSWFLDTWALPTRIGKESIEAWQPVARMVVDDYLRLALWSESQTQEGRTTFVHPAVSTYLASLNMRRDMEGRLIFDARTPGIPSAGHTPNVLVNRMLDNMKNTYTSLPEWVFLPWKRTFMGLIPPDPLA